ncbi:MAG TPA: hypothetical protein VMW45_03750 [Dehalococcoidia bacterium]|nr:hypothetical protein [Dehalococcoidia bacterium]
MAELEEQIKVVARGRAIVADLTAVKGRLYDKWVEDNKEHLTALRDTRLTVEEAEAKLRELTLQAYAETGNKAPAPGVGIRERTVLTYDGKVAFDWAKSHKMALQLDKKAFEKIAKADTPDFVKVSTEAIATIATELKVE